MSRQDPHGDLKNQNVLIVRGSLEKTAEHFKMADTAEAGQLLAECRKRMYEERQKRPRPHRDNKILTAWNGQHNLVTIKYCMAEVRTKTMFRLSIHCDQLSFH